MSCATGIYTGIGFGMKKNLHLPFCCCHRAVTSPPELCIIKTKNMVHTKEMEMVTGVGTLVHDYAAYNYWANTTLLNWLKSKPTEALEKEIASSFAGIKATLVHIWDTERFWLSVIKQEPAPPSFRMTGFDGSLQQVFEGMEKTANDFARVVNEMDDETLMEKVSFDTPWVKGTRTRFEFIHHCMNHSTYHRGQITTMGHHVDLHDAPMTDYCFYLLMVKNS